MKNMMWEIKREASRHVCPFNNQNEVVNKYTILARMSQIIENYKLNLIHAILHLNVTLRKKFKVPETSSILVASYDDRTDAQLTANMLEIKTTVSICNKFSI